MNTHALLNTSLQIRQPRGIGERDYLALAAALRLRLTYLVLCTPPSAWVAQEVVYEALEAGGDGIGAGTDIGCGERLEAAL